MPIKFFSTKRGGQHAVLVVIMLAVIAVSTIPARADIALVDTVGEKSAPTITSSIPSSPASVTISNFTVSPMANVLVVLVEDKGASAINSEPATLAWGSQTVLKAITQDNFDSTRRGSSIYYLFNPTPGTNNITAAVANSPADIEITAYTLSGVDTTIAPKVAGTPASGTSTLLTFNVPGVVAGSWAAVNTTWASTSPFPVITGTGGTATTTSYIATIAGTSSVMTAGYISGLSAGTDTFAAAWAAGAQKNNFAIAVFTPLTTAINITATSASPNPVLLGSSVLLSVTASSTAGAISNVIVDASAIGGPSVLPLTLSAGNIYTNSVKITTVFGGAILPVTVRDSANNTLTGSLQVTVQTLADAELDAYNKAYMLPPRADGRIYFAQSLSNRNAETDGWKHAIDIQGEEDAYERTGDPQQRQLVHSLCATWLLQSPIPWTGDGWNDDIGWFSLVLIRGYQMTGNPEFLTAAEYGFDMAFARGWDTNYNNGGIWELQPADTTNPHKEALSCDSLEQAALMIYQSTTNATYLTRAEQIYSWVRINLFNPSTGAVYNGIKTNGVVDTGVNLYNVGTFVDCANLLHNITGQQVYYNDALNAVNYARNYKTVNGIFKGSTGNYTWAAEFARGLGHFVKDNNLWSTYYPWMLANANAAWNCRRPDYNVSWNDWTTPTPITTDVTVGWAVNAVAMMWATPTGQATNYTLNYGGANIVQPGGSDWNTANNWNPLGIGASLSVLANPASTFEIKPGSRLRTPTTSAAFPGLQLTLDGNGAFENTGNNNPVNVSELRFKTGDAAMTNYFNNLVLNGGELNAGNGGVEIIQGNLAVAANSTLYVDTSASSDRGFRIDSQLTGSGNLFWHEWSGGLGGVNLQITGTGNTFSGQWIVDQGALVGVGINSLGTNNIIVGTNGLAAAVETMYDLNNTNANLVLGANGKIFLHQNDNFASVIINGTALTNGTYSFAALNSTYPANFPVSWAQQTGSTFTTGSGQIIVGNVVAEPPSSPHITGIGLNRAALSISATNGTPGSSWTLLQSTNLALRLSQWQTNCAGNFDGSGSLSTNLVNTATSSQEFYILKVQ